ncbi:hypothetical protein [Thauera sp.]|uniref:hypothetical protein n=1 Tax=Thauera sp. TaxID=1905334 RepID=UPI0039E6E3A3
MSSSRIRSWGDQRECNPSGRKSEESGDGVDVGFAFGDASLPDEEVERACRYCGYHDSDRKSLEGLSWYRRFVHSDVFFLWSRRYPTVHWFLGMYFPWFMFCAGFALGAADILRQLEGVL